MVSFSVLAGLLLLCVISPSLSEKCERDYEKMGCVPEDKTKMELIVNHRMITDWNNFPVSIYRLLCECSKTARAGGFTFFSIRFWAECWAGKDTSAMEDILNHGEDKKTCVAGDFKPCVDNNDNDCVGTDEVGYVYYVKPSVDGGLSEWSGYTKCTKPCAGGVMSRTRSCTNPKPMYGGKTCTGQLEQKLGCNVKPCPVDGELTSWTEFSKCDKECGGGVSTRSRNCLPPKFGGKGCTKPLMESKACNTNHCPVPGGYSQWTNWARCSKTCGEGSQQRIRSCNSPAPAYGGAKCVGPRGQSRRCNSQQCVCKNFRFVARGKQCRSGTYTRQRGRCDGWQRVGLEECKRKCIRNEAPGGCPRRKCEYVIWDTNPGTPPGWCQLGTSACQLGGTNNGHTVYKRSC